MVRVGYKIDGVMWSLCLFLSYTLFIQVKNKKDEKMWDIIQKIKNILLTAIVLLVIFYLPLYASTFKDGKNSIVVGISGGIQRVIFHDYASFTDIFKQPFLSTSIGYQRDTQTSAAKASWLTRVDGLMLLWLILKQISIILFIVWILSWILL